jgi:hypothetical protein
VAIICTIGNIATLQPRLEIPLISHVGVMLQNSKFNIYSDHGCILLFTKMQPECGITRQTRQYIYRAQKKLKKVTEIFF